MLTRAHARRTGSGTYSFVRRGIEKSTGREVAIKCVSKVRWNGAVVVVRSWWRWW